MSEKPNLRQLDFQPIHFRGEQMWLLRDPLRLVEQQLIIPPALATMLIFCDGTRTPAEIHRALCQQIGVEIELALVLDNLARLDEACLLENERSRRARAALLASYRAQSHRQPVLADLSYPGHPAMLDQLLAGYANGDSLGAGVGWQGRGIISPHIDYQRGGPVYATVWHHAAPALAQADLVLVFGTDHNGEAGSLTLTGLPYRTPYGLLPTDPQLINSLAQAIGPEAAFACELHHREEHSIELSAVWLHYMYRRMNLSPRPMVPILCGGFHHFVSMRSHPEQDGRLTAMIETLRCETAGRRVLAVASVDLAHVGPSFGDDFVMDERRRTALAAADARLMGAISQGDAAEFYAQIASVGDQNRICGFSAIYLLLRFLGSTSGMQVAYDHCPADAQEHSLVSICGMLLG